MRTPLVVFTVLLVLASAAAVAAEGDWKRGRIYYRMVCTDCHKSAADMKISPMERTIAEWNAYLDTDAHNTGGKNQATVRHFTSRAYRESIKETNPAAEKLLEVPETELFSDVRAWLVRGAKDSDTPARCQ